MEETKKGAKKTSTKEKLLKKQYVPKAKVKKEYLVVLVKQSSLIVSLDGITNTIIAKTKELEGLKVGDRVKL